jgi:hypothetical protein
MLQRVRMMSSMAANAGAGGGTSLVRPRGPAADSHAIAIMPAAASPHVHHGLLFPAWRALKKCRMRGPMASTIATMIQLYRVAYKSG